MQKEGEEENSKSGGCIQNKEFANGNTFSPSSSPSQPSFKTEGRQLLHSIHVHSMLPRPPCKVGQFKMRRRRRAININLKLGTKSVQEEEWK